MNSENEDNPYPDITQYGSWYYLKRKVIIISNSIKINYGNNIDNTPTFILNYMTKYITNLSMIFDGLYIYSVVCLPMFILKYFIDVARKIKPSIILLCDIPEEHSNNIEEEENLYNNVSNQNNESNFNFKNNNIHKKLKKKYVEELGINLFSYELIWNNTITDIIKNIIKNGSSCNSNIYQEIISHFNNNLYSTAFLGDNKISFGKFKYLKPKKPFNILFDFNKDNLSYFEKFKFPSLNISILSLITLLDTSIGNIYIDKFQPSSANKNNN